MGIINMQVYNLASPFFVDAAECEAYRKCMVHGLSANQYSKNSGNWQYVSKECSKQFDAGDNCNFMDIIEDFTPSGPKNDFMPYEVAVEYDVGYPDVWPDILGYENALDAAYESLLPVSADVYEYDNWAELPVNEYVAEPY